MDAGTDPGRNIEILTRFLESNQPLLVLTGAGCSTASGIPAYRDHGGRWQHPPPVYFRDFSGSEAVRQRYWARAMTGWRRVIQARPNAAHIALAELEREGFLQGLITQNVDGLHQRAGSLSVIDLHGRLDGVVCLDCGLISSRAAFQEELWRHNPEFRELDAENAPDGDARLIGVDYKAFRVPECARCGGRLKPDVVFYGESVPAKRVRESLDWLDRARGLLVVGSSLMVYSGYRFCRRAFQQQKPVAAINLGRTRADEGLALKVEADCGAALTKLLESLTSKI